MESYTRWGQKLLTSELPKSFEEKCEALGIPPDVMGAAELSPPLMDIASAHAFCTYGRTGDDKKYPEGYRQAAIERCVDSGLPFSTQENVVMSAVKLYVRIVSPYTGELLGPEQITDGGGSGNHSSWRWKDSKGNVISLGFDNHALSFQPAPEREPVTGKPETPESPEAPEAPQPSQG
jgi:hypothetical protein